MVPFTVQKGSSSSRLSMSSMLKSCPVMEISFSAIDRLMRADTNDPSPPSGAPYTGASACATRVLPITVSATPHIPFLTAAWVTSTVFSKPSFQDWFTSYTFLIALQASNMTGVGVSVSVAVYVNVSVAVNVAGGVRGGVRGGDNQIWSRLFELCFVAVAVVVAFVENCAGGECDRCVTSSVMTEFSNKKGLFSLSLESDGRSMVQ
mmetsp:Transcript_18371/g.41925  ORF Transcript_18371/g.41925 Transcript_18371/m.41925 type:complete len:206 (+) Transcript_18371:1073-1690(+)